MIYSICLSLLLIGAAGLVVQLLLGAAHVGHAGNHAHIGHGGHAGHAHTGHAAHASHSGHGAQGSRGGRGASVLLTLMSPLTIFGLCIGAGATGLLLKGLHLPSIEVTAGAVAGGLVFYGLLVRPLLGLVLSFASTPSAALEGTLAREAEVLTRFDDTGKGLVRLNVDGQLIRVLATLEGQDRDIAGEIKPGDRLTVTSVDGHTNSCRVARL